MNFFFSWHYLNVLKKVSKSLKYNYLKLKSIILSIAICFIWSAFYWFVFFSEPCEKTFCSHGATCHPGTDGRATCRCPDTCPSSGSPVCGTDGRTYQSLCALRQHSCLHRENIRVQHPGECGKFRNGFFINLLLSSSIYKIICHFIWILNF